MKSTALHHSTHREMRDYPAAAVQSLSCPHCGAPLAAGDGFFACPIGHTFDIARQGYVALLGARARTDTGDTADMVAARTEFLQAGHYRPIAAAVSAVARVAVGAGPVLEIGAGTGYYLTVLLDGGSQAAGIALDSSKYAARRAAADPRLVSVVADAWSALPIRTGAVRSVLSIFAPRDPAEMTRVLGPGGLLIAVTPDPAHLIELRDRLTMLTVDEGKADRLADSLAGLLTPAGRQPVEFRMTLRQEDVTALVRMGPTARHLAPAELAAQIRALPPSLTVTAAVTVSRFDKA